MLLAIILGQEITAACVCMRQALLWHSKGNHLVTKGDHLCGCDDDDEDEDDNDDDDHRRF